MLSRLIQPKWKSKNPDSRRAAIPKIKDPSILVKLANTDPDLSVRKAAIFATPDIHTLLLTEQHERLDRSRAERLAELMFITTEPVSLNPEIEYLFEHIKDSRFFTRVLIDAACPKMRVVAATYLDDENCLADVILHDASAEVRALCASRLQSEEPIRSVLKKLPKKEKRTAKILRAKLEEIESINAIIVRKESLLKKVSSLGNTDEWQREQTTLMSLRNEWKQLSAHDLSDLDAKFHERERSAQERITARKFQAASLQPVIDEKTGQCAFVEAYLEKLNQKQRTSTEEASDINSTLDLFADEWRQQPALPESIESPLANRFHDALSACRKRVSELQERSQKTAHLEAILSNAQKMLLHTDATEKEIQNLEDDWRQQQLPGDSSLAIEYKDNFDELFQQLKTKIEKNRLKKTQGLKLIEHYIEQVEASLSQEKLGNSTQLIKKAKKTLEGLAGLCPNERRKIEQRIKSFTPTIKTLEGWRHWGTDRAREELISEAESLGGANITIKERTEQVKSLRNRWKNLGSIDPGARTALWNRFDIACNKAYEPCKAQFEEETETRNKNLGKRRSICETLKELRDTTDWESPDWRSVDKAFRSLQSQWRECGPVNRKDWPTISEEYRQLLININNRLEEERNKNRKFREDLIAQIEILKNEENAEIAAEKLKKLQKQWQVTVSGKRGLEQKLWRNFKAAGDTIYNKEKLRKQAAIDEVNVALIKKENVCDQLENLTGPNHHIKQQLAALEQQWNETTVPEHRSARALQARYDAAIESCHADILCNDIETQRSELGTLFETAKNSRGPQIDTAEIEELLLDVEIQLNVDSPSAYRQQRMKKQVDRLSARLGKKQSTSLENTTSRFKKLLGRDGLGSTEHWERIAAVYSAIDNELINRVAEIKQA